MHFTKVCIRWYWFAFIFCIYIPENKENIGHFNRGNKSVGSFFCRKANISSTTFTRKILALSGCGMPLNALVEYFGFFEGIKLAVMGGSTVVLRKIGDFFSTLQNGR